jgi:tetratricopeptide (TPR) repeat protein/DNA-binding winged helix-turn-helix (wHTH) protein
LRPQAYAVLRHLAERQGRTVPVDDLCELLWKSGARPSDPADSIAQAIAAVRRALGDGSDEIIHKVPGGYMFVPPVEVLTRKVGPAAVVEEAPLAGNERAPAPPSSDSAQARPLGTRNWLIRQPDRRSMALAALVLMLVALTLVPRFRARDGDVAASAVDMMMATPTIAVVAGAASSAINEGALQAFSDELAAELRRTPRGFDLSIKAAAPGAYADRPAGTVASALDVRYLLRVSLQQQPDGRLVIAQLVEGPTGRQIWASSYPLLPDGIHAQNVLAARIGRDVAVQIRTAEVQRKLPRNPQAGHFTLQGRVLLESERNAEVNTRAMALFDAAAALDPRHVQSRLGKARTRFAAVANGWIQPSERDAYLAEAERTVAEILEIDRATPGAYLLRGSLQRIKGDYDGAVAAYAHTTTLNPNYVLAHAELGRVLLDKGEPGQAMVHIGRALELSPNDPVSSVWYYWAGMAAAQSGNFEGCVGFMNRALQANAAYHQPRLWLAVAQARLGRMDDGRRILTEFLASNPKFSVDRWLQLHARGDARIRDRLRPFAATLLDLGAPQKS